MADDRRSAEPRIIEPDDIQEVAERFDVSVDLVAEAIAAVGPNLTAVELWLSAPQA